MKYQITDPRIKPEYMTPSSDGANSVDLRACIAAPLTLAPGEQALISCGIKVELPLATMGTILPRSGKGSQGLVLGNLVGNVDSDYRGEVKVCLWNRSKVHQVIQPMERVAQFVVVLTHLPKWIQAGALSSTERDSGGFGSTGSK